MKINTEEPIVDYKKVSKKKILKIIILGFLIMLVGSKIFSGVNTIMSNIAEKEKKQRIEERYREKNYEINIVTDFEDETFVGKIKEIEFDNGIKIPTLYKYTESDDVEFFLKTREDNILTKASPVVKMKYPNDSGTGLVIDLYCQILEKKSYRRFANLKYDLKSMVIIHILLLIKIILLMV